MSLPELSFDDFYDQAALERFLADLATARPKIARVESLATTPEGRALPLLEVTDRSTGVAGDKPGYLVHANIHAHELTTTTSALHLARTLVAGHGVDEAITELLRRVSFYIVPRLNPDGAEYAFKTNGSVRSRSYPREVPNGLTQTDVDGDGQILWMRWPDPDGEYAAHPEDSRLLIQRQPDHPGPFYRMVPEGTVYQYEGGPVHLSDRRIDFNRQWPAAWEPEHVQAGAGDFPFSEPEMRAIGEFVIGHPNIFAMLGFHTGGNGVLRASATRDDEELNAEDVRLMREVGERGAEMTGFELFSVRQYCRTYSVDAKLRGHFTDWAYSHLGTLTYEIELGNLYNSAGVTTEQWRDAKPAERDGFALDALRWSDAEGYGAFVPWRPFEHPDLGPVELGGWVRYRLANPSLGHLEAICRGCTEFICHHASLAPRLEVRATAEPFGEVYRLRAEVLNSGRLPTQVMQAASSLRWVQGPEVRLTLPEGAELLSRRGNQRVGHLAKLRGKQELEWFIRAPAGGTVTVEAACARAGRAATKVSL